MVGTGGVYERLKSKLQDREWNLRFRRYVILRGHRDPRFAEAMRRLCARDALFFINVFVWTYDPRRTPRAKLPMITYEYQDGAILTLLEAVVSGHDELIEKSRDMGASWICLLAFLWFWMFCKFQSFLLVSRVEGYVDDKGNSKSLFWKIDFALKHMPYWLRPLTSRTKMHLENLTTSSVIDGESTTGDVGRGDRRTGILLDEFGAVEQGHRVLGSTRDATSCRVFNSTHQGTGTAYYAVSRTGIAKLRMHWSEHPFKGRGLYTKRGSDYVFIDSEYWSRQNDPQSVARDLDGKILRLSVPLEDGKLRSPWYAEQCDRSAHAVEIAQELDIDCLGSSYQFFSAFSIEDYIQRHSAAPYRTGDLLYDPESLEPTGWRDNPRGLFKLWMVLDGRGFPLLGGEMCLGCDVSAGTGASNSALSAIHRLSLEKVLEYANPHVRPEAFGKLAVAVARWLGQAFCIWEQSGPGRQFGDAVIESGYRHVYYRRDEEKVLKNMSNVPGWVPTRDNKLTLLGDYRRALELQTVINRSEAALRDTLEYVFLPNQSVEHSAAAKNADPTGARSNHGDRAIADALAWKISKGKSPAVKPQDSEVFPPGSFGFRRQEARLAQTRKTIWN